MSAAAGRGGWQGLSWQQADLNRALLELAKHSHLVTTEVAFGSPPAGLDALGLDRWIVASADHAGFIAQSVHCKHADLAQTLARVAPALLRLELDSGRVYLAVTGARGRNLRVLTPRLDEVWLALDQVAQSLCLGIERAPLERIDQWLSAARVPPRRARIARRELLAALLGSRRISGLWLLRLDPGASFWTQLRQRGVLRRASLVVLLSGAQVLLTLYAWWLLGRGALGGRLELGWLVAWILAGTSAMCCQATNFWLGGAVVNEVAGLLKQRLLCGALRLDLDRIRSGGSGRFLAMVSESEVFESAGLGALVSTLLAGIQLVSAAAVIAIGAGGSWQLLTLLGWSCLVGCAFWDFCRQRSVWTEQRFGLARAFVENVVGNRTRVIQQPPPRWHLSEDRGLGEYLRASRRLDAAAERLTVLPARGWFVLGLSSLVPAVLQGHLQSASVALAIGGLFQAYAAFEGLALGLTGVGAALVAWRQLSELYHAAAARPNAGHPALALPSTPAPLAAELGPPLLEVRGLSFRYRARAGPALDHCDLLLRAGERLLLEGPSGGGKSTFASLLVGLRVADTGHVLLGGLDRPTLGQAAWLQRIASVPQFHENHILSASLAFNVLMGRAWPPSASDLVAAGAVCRELGLGALLDRMPAGLHQIVGETGWQLSHGERSRVFLARALVQQSALLVLDESFGALDPHTLGRCMQAVFARAPTLIAIAHP